jgi:CheY-like chemotaxis protein
MKCPRCQAPVTTAPDPSGVIICAGCGARLRGRPGPSAPAAPPAPAAAPANMSDGPATAPATAPAAAPAAAAPRAPRAPKPGSATLPGVAVEPAGGLDAILAEIRAVRGAQEEILALLRERSGERADRSRGDDAFGGPDDTVPPPPPVVRSRRRKTVLLIDDDPESRAAALKALELAEVPTRTALDGSAGLAAIAQERPDVVVLELGMGGDMSGRDVVNMIKATMEWVDLPIVLYTRVAMDGQKEARTMHGADELVPKGAGAAEQLVARVIALFRKG